MSEIVFRGYLYKSPPESFGSSLKPWRMRWCILADSRLAFPFATPYIRLEYYASEHYANELDEPKGVIDLKDCIEVVDRRPMKGHDHVFDLRTDKRAYHFAASSVEVKSVWIESLTAVLRNNTESIPGDPANFLRVGVGNNAGDLSMESPVYSAFTLPRVTNSSDVPRSMQENDYSSFVDESAQPPVSTSTIFDNGFQDDYQHLQHTKPADVKPPPPVVSHSGTSTNYNLLARSFVQDDDDDDADDYQHLNHKKHNQNGHHTATISNANTSTYDRINRAGGNYDRFNQHSATVTSVASMYSSLNMKDDYQRLDDCTIRHNSQGYLQSSKQSATLDSSYHYNQPRVPAVPARKCAYENTPHTLPRSFK